MNYPDFLIIPYILINDENITPLEEKLYGVIYWYTKLKLQKCTASNDTLAKMIGKRASSASVANGLMHLEERGYIRRKFKDETRKTRSEIIPLVTYRVSSANETVSSVDETQVSSVDEQSKSINNKKSNKKVAAQGTAKEFLFEKELESLKNGGKTGNRKDYKIIALYWKKKGFVFENREQFEAALVRELRAAKALRGYTGEQIARSIAYCAKEYPEIYTLETAGKRIADLVNKKTP